MINYKVHFSKHFSLTVFAIQFKRYKLYIGGIFVAFNGPIAIQRSIMLVHIAHFSIMVFVFFKRGQLVYRWKDLIHKNYYPLIIQKRFSFIQRNLFCYLYRLMGPQQATDFALFCVFYSCSDTNFEILHIQSVTKKVNFL